MVSLTTRTPQTPAFASSSVPQENQTFPKPPSIALPALAHRNKHFSNHYFQCRFRRLRRSSGALPGLPRRRVLIHPSREHPRRHPSPLHQMVPGMGADLAARLHARGDCDAHHPPNHPLPLLGHAQEPPQGARLGASSRLRSAKRVRRCGFRRPQQQQQ